VKEAQADLERRLGYAFKDKTLLTQALTHKSAGSPHNERLEFLGDAVLNVIIADLLYSQHTKAREGVLTRARSHLVKQITLSEIAQIFRLGAYLHLGIGEQRSGGFRRDSILADALEAIIGAVYVDSDFMTCYQCVHRWFEAKIAALDVNAQEKDPKTQLQEWLQANQKSLPKYEVISIGGKPHQQIFTVSCEVEKLSLSAKGTGNSRRIAEQQAAQEILAMIIT